MGVVGRGLAAGLAGRAALDTVGYLDMALRGRPASEVPGELVGTVADRAGLEIPGRRRERAVRRAAIGELSGTLTALAVGVGASVARASGVRLPGPLGSVALGAAAMAGVEVPVALLGVGDPRRWTLEDWAGDAVPHLAFGIATHAVLGLSDTRVDSVRSARQVPASPGLVLRSAALGLATGMRSTLGVAGPVLTAPRPVSARLQRMTGRRGAVLAVLSVLGEVTADKLPVTPSRLTPPSMVVRLGSGASGAAALARRQSARAVLPAVVGALGSLASSFAGARWRERASTGRADWPGAVAEDAVALTLTALACLPGRRPAQPGRR